MSMVRSLRIRLGNTEVGSLFELEDGRTYFRFDDKYAQDPARPVLSQLYLAGTEADTIGQLMSPSLAANRGDGKWGLPTFFQNLLPEGLLRKHLMERASLSPDDEFGLLAYCGLDLPGDVWAVSESLSEPMMGRLLGQGFDSYEMSSGQLPAPEGESISGVQPKVALVHSTDGRYVMRSKTSDGHFIGKLPVSNHEALPEVEHFSLLMAQAAGVETCEHELLPLSAISDRLPFALRSESERFLLVHRFDRDVATPTKRRHMEDFAQVTGTPAGEKYSGTYAAIGAILLARSERGEEDVFELLRRIKVNELLGNFDAHLKNFSLLYTTPQTARLSPAYDIVAYSAYMGGRGHALKFLPDQKAATKLTPVVIRALANIWRLPETKMGKVVAETVDSAMTTWPKILEESAIPEHLRVRVSAFLEENESVKAWCKRHRHVSKPATGDTSVTTN